jgi:hypothetical protein
MPSIGVPMAGSTSVIPITSVPEPVTRGSLLLWDRVHNPFIDQVRSPRSPGLCGDLIPHRQRICPAEAALAAPGMATLRAPRRRARRHRGDPSRPVEFYEVLDHGQKESFAETS